MPCPEPWIYVQLAERFPGLGAPWHVKDEPADDVYFYMGLLGIEGEHRVATHGMSPDEELYTEE